MSLKNSSPKEKKSFKLKLRENSDRRRHENNHFQKNLSSYCVKNARKSQLKALVTKKEIYTAIFFKLCAAEDL